MLSPPPCVGLAILVRPLLDILNLFMRHCTQKNGQHGEEHLYTLSDDPTPPHDAVACFYRLLLNFSTLRQRDPALREDATPLAIYWDPTLSMVRLVTADEIEACMRALAVKTYCLDPVKDKAALQLWSSHSLRVGACVLLHAMGFPPQDIK